MVLTNIATISDGIQSFQVSVPVTMTGPNLAGSYKTVNNLQPSTGEYITYTIVLSNSGEADAIVNSVVRRALGEAGTDRTQIGRPGDWSHDPDDWEAARRKLAEAILRAKERER